MRAGVGQVYWLGNAIHALGLKFTGSKTIQNAEMGLKVKQKRL